MDRIKEEEWYCPDCEANFLVCFDNSHPDDVTFCPFCGSADVTQEKEEAEKDDDDVDKDDDDEE
jgi:hypothetical protein